MTLRARLRDLVLMSILPVALLALWEVSVRQHLVSTFLLPSIGQVVQRIGADLSSGDLLQATVGTAMRLVASYAIAAVSGVVLGILMSRIFFIRWFLDPVISIAYPMPKISLLPIFVLWFGVFDKPKIVISAFACVFPIIAGTFAGTQGVDKYLVWSAENLGTKPAQMLWKVILPAALPQILTSLQIALPIAFITVIVAEMLTGGGGLGGAMMESARLADPSGVFANLVVIAILGFIAIRGLEFARRRILVWHEEVQRQGAIV